MRDICRSDRIAFRPNDRLFLPKSKQNNDSIPAPCQSGRTIVQGPARQLHTMGHLGRTHSCSSFAWLTENVAHHDSQQVLHDPHMRMRIRIRFRFRIRGGSPLAPGGVVLLSDLFSLYPFLKLLAPNCKIVLALVVMTYPYMS